MSEHRAMNVTTRRATTPAVAAEASPTAAFDDDAAAAAALAVDFETEDDILDVDMAMNIAAILEAESGIADGSAGLGLIAEQDEIMLSLAQHDDADDDAADDADGVLLPSDDDSMHDEAAASAEASPPPADDVDEEEEEDDSDGKSDGPPAGGDATLESIMSRGFVITPTWDARSVVDSSLALRSLNDDCIWMLSSARPGNGIEELLSMDNTKFWQSDGTAPHTILIQFYKRESIAELSMLLSFPLDESYCPQRIGIRAGSTMLDLEEVRRVDLDQPNGYVRIPFINPEKRGLQRYLRCHVLQIVFVSNHQQGRDCHVRCMRVLAPPVDNAGDAGNVTGGSVLGTPIASGGPAVRADGKQSDGLSSLYAPRWQTGAMHAFGIR